MTRDDHDEDEDIEEQLEDTGKDREKAGKILKKVKEESKKLLKPGAKLLDIADKIEALIKEHDGKPAAPANLSLNDIAAHYVPAVDDVVVLGEKDLLKVDLCVHVNGFVVDSAFSFDAASENSKLVETAEEALNNAISMVRAGVNTRDIGEEIEKTITKKGFKPIENLCGHGVGYYKVHTAPSIPNVKTEHGVELEEGQVIAIEPFASTGRGYVTEDRNTQIFSWRGFDVLTRNQDARRLLEKIKQEYRTLPFAERWLAGGMDLFKLRVALRELVGKEGLRSYPALKETRGARVAQSEHTIVIEKDSCKVLT